MIQAFTLQNWRKRISLMPCEDSFRLCKDKRRFIGIVADGVTRDPTEHLPDTSSLFGKVMFALHYPRPSPARIAADIATSKIMGVLRDYGYVDERAIRTAFEEANNSIVYWNNNHISNPNYTTRDSAGCVASVGALNSDGSLYWGFLTDCGVAVFDNGELKFRTPDESPHRLDKFISEDLEIKGKSWREPEVRAKTRTHYRNNPNEEHSFGVLTGQREAMDYVHVGKQEFKPGQHLVIYSDGLEDAVFSQEFARMLRNAPEKIKRLCRRKVKTEGTLIHYPG